MSSYFERLVSRLGDFPGVQPVPAPPPAPVIDPFAEAEAADLAAMPDAPIAAPAPVDPPLAPPAFVPARRSEIALTPEPIDALELPPTPSAITEIVTIERSRDNQPAAPEPVELEPPVEPPAPVVGTRERIVERVELRDVSPSPPAPLESPPSEPLAPPVELNERDMAIHELQPPAPEPPTRAAQSASPVVVIEPPRDDDVSEPVPPHTPARETKISIGEIVVEVVQQAAPPPVRPRPARSPRRAPAAPRPGVRSKRGFGIGQM